MKDSQPEERLVDEYKGAISYQDLKFVVELHVALVQNFTKTEWLNPTPDKNICHNFLNPLLEKYKVFNYILRKSIHCLDYTMDTKLITSLNVLLCVLQRYGQTSDICKLRLFIFYTGLRPKIMSFMRMFSFPEKNYNLELSFNFCNKKDITCMELL